MRFSSGYVPIHTEPSPSSAACNKIFWIDADKSYGYHASPLSPLYVVFSLPKTIITRGALAART